MAGITHAFVSAVADGADANLVRPSNWNAAHIGGIFVKAETRDLAAASGDVSYTGYGFTPVGLIILAFYAAVCGSIGASEPAKTAAAIFIKYDSSSGIDLSLIYLFQASANNRQFAVVKSYDADGFTLTWTKVGSPTGTANLSVFAFA